MQGKRGWTDLREAMEMALDVLRTNPLRWSWKTGSKTR